METLRSRFADDGAIKSATGRGNILSVSKMSVQNVYDKDSPVFILFKVSKGSSRILVGPGVEFMAGAEHGVPFQGFGS